MKEKVANLEQHQETLRQHIKTKDNILESIKNKSSKIPEVAVKSIQATREQENVINASPKNDEIIDTKLKRFSTDILDKVTRIVDEKLDELKKINTNPLDVERIEAKINDAVDMNKSYAASVKKNLSENK